ncbi:hypothetical protein D3C72_705980 [compost metagenome]
MDIKSFFSAQYNTVVGVYLPVVIVQLQPALQLQYDIAFRVDGGDYPQSELVYPIYVGQVNIRSDAVISQVAGQRGVVKLYTALCKAVQAGYVHEAAILLNSGEGEGIQRHGSVTDSRCRKPHIQGTRIDH